MLERMFRLAVVIGLSLLGVLACATLPDADELQQRHAGQEASFRDARGTLSRQKSAAILAQLKGRSGEIDILDRHLAIEQAIVGSPLVLGNKVSLLQDGATTYAAMFAAMRKARDHINLQSYIIEDDEIGRQFADLLLEQQRRGVQVNLIYDSVGALNTPKAFFERLTDGGIAVLEFNPINPLSARRGWLLNQRDHRKLLVVDGRTAFLGGINISSVYSSGSIPRRSAKSDRQAVPWRDTHLQIDGPVVSQFQKLFLETWEKQHGPLLAVKAYFPALKAEGNEIVRAIGSTPDDPYSLIYLTLISAIDSAEKEVYLTNAYFVPARYSAILARCCASGNRPRPAARLSCRCCTLLVAGMTQVTAGWARMNLRKNCAQLAQSNSATHSGSGLPRTCENSEALAKGRLMMTAMPRSCASGNRRFSASRSAML
jgi:cardiolipin synthase